MIYLGSPVADGQSVYTRARKSRSFLRCVSYRCSVFLCLRQGIAPRKIPTFFFPNKFRNPSKQLIGAGGMSLLYICIEINRSVHTQADGVYVATAS